MFVFKIKIIIFEAINLNYNHKNYYFMKVQTKYKPSTNDLMVFMF